MYNVHHHYVWCTHELSWKGGHAAKPKSHFEGRNLNYAVDDLFISMYWLPNTFPSLQPSFKSSLQPPPQQQQKKTVCSQGFWDFAIVKVEIKFHFFFPAAFCG